MNETAVMIVYIISILTGIAIMYIAYNMGVNSQKRINKLINDKDKYDGFLKGYKLGYNKGKSEKSKCDGKR
jgi:hypothetical protein